MLTQIYVSFVTVQWKRGLEHRVIWCQQFTVARGATVYATSIRTPSIKCRP